jgi:hypothetical protein
MAALCAAPMAVAQDWRKQAEDLLKQAAPQAAGGSVTDERTTASGLKEALRVGTSNAVRLTSAPDGFFGNDKIHIPLPGQLDRLARTLRGIGMSAQVDELELTMNRAAEKAAREATPVFVDAIQKMTFADARGILQGDDTAATQYFQRTTSDTLTTRFRPIVQESMKKVGLAQQYDALVGHYKALPLAKAPTLDLTGYVTQKALDGLFFVVGEEERKIRTNPAARTTELLKQVFGGA